MSLPRAAIAVSSALCLLAASFLVVPARVQADLVDLHIYGSNPGGWGRDAVNLTKPGPYLTYVNGTQLRLTLFSVDAPNPHNWYVDFNNDRDNASEPSSGTFSTSTANTFPAITLNRTGNYTYRCIFHNAMNGAINITEPGPGGGGGGLGGGTVLDYTWLWIILGAVAAAAVGGYFFMRYMRKRRTGG